MWTIPRMMCWKFVEHLSFPVWARVSVAISGCFVFIMYKSCFCVILCSRITNVNTSHTTPLFHYKGDPAVIIPKNKTSFSTNRRLSSTMHKTAMRHQSTGTTCSAPTCLTHSTYCTFSGNTVWILKRRFREIESLKRELQHKIALRKNSASQVDSYFTCGTPF